VLRPAAASGLAAYASAMQPVITISTTRGGTWTVRCTSCGAYVGLNIPSAHVVVLASQAVQHVCARRDCATSN
jgi:hypothetical protein